MEAFLKKQFKKTPSFTSKSEKETFAFAGEFAFLLTPGDSVALTGNLGSGKTHFVKGMAEFFGVKRSKVVSPTFNLLKEYKGKSITVYHFDFYRLKSMDELDKIGYRHYLTGEGSILVAEWPEKVAETWRDFNWVVRFEHKGGNKRKITVMHMK